tara:strand:- start:1017 stop:1145 length:129 start_codon:yes stop_codon:yes gene_type:complete
MQTDHQPTAGETFLTLAGSAVALVALLAIANVAPDLLLKLLH